MPENVIRIATRSSKLALWQAHHVKGLIEAADPSVAVEIVHVRTQGDQNQTDALRNFGGTGVFTREVQSSVLSGETHLAVHSLKDLQTDATEGLVLAGIPPRAPRCDALLLPKGQKMESLDDLPQSARVGTGSPRRQAQLLHARPDLTMLEIRGNVDTRIRKLDDGEYDAIVLAEAGLRRLELADRISFMLTPPVMIPAVGQGALGIECRSDDDSTQHILESISDVHTAAEVRAERAMLSRLRAGCHAPVGVMSEISADGETLSLDGVILSLDGRTKVEAAATGPVNDPAATGVAVADSLLARGGDALI